MAKQSLRVDHGPVDEDLTLTEAEKAWLRAWNRHDEIPGESAPESDEDGDDDGSDGDDGYEDMSVDDLKAELAKRDLPVSGNKAALVARLEEDDDSDEE